MNHDNEPGRIIDKLGAAILAAAADGILLADRDGIIRFWNPGAVRIFGFSAEEAIGQSLDLIIPNGLRARHTEGYRRVMQTGETRYGSGDLLAVPALTKDGSQISVEFTIVPMSAAGSRPIGMAAILRDVTSRFNEMRTLRRRVTELEKSAMTAVRVDEAGQ
ncbi:MAG: PAS domain S-box protein [Bauldia sp.]|nr:PAS domain S-box protein [Bauldia sp.]